MDNDKDHDDDDYEENLNKMDNKQNLNINDTKNILSQIENLSNYVIFLINDMIEYSNLHEIDNIMVSSKNKHISNDLTNGNSNVNKMNIKIEKVNLREIYEFCRDITQTLILSKGRERNVSILNEFDQKIELYTLLSDEFRMKQILLNFISNSVKFTKWGFIKIKSDFFHKEEPNANESNNKDEKNENKKEKSKIKISVIDSGKGIKQNDLQTLLKFEDNTMLKATDTLNNGGSGLGLSITKFLAEKLNHQLETISE